MPAPTRVLRASWSSTLCLPKSTFPPRPILADRPKYLKQCTDDLYAWQRNSSEFTNKTPFVLHDGPPYANGSLHIGHALNKILKDIILRVQLAQGRPVEYVPGWDCHGLPIELKALQLHKEKSGERFEDCGEQRRNAVQIRHLARSLAVKTVEEQRDNFRQWAVMGDWDQPYKTLDRDFELRQLEVFRQMLAKGLIYRKFKPVYWSPSTQTALAEAELEYKDDHISHAAYVALDACDGAQLRQLFSMEGSDVVKFLIWTTTPWTLPANKAIAVHEDLDYVCAFLPGIGYSVVAQARLAAIEETIGVSFTGPLYGPIKGSALASKEYRNDAFAANQKGNILIADFVSADSGTGLVHCAPGHGMDDYNLCLKLGIKPFAPVDDSGCFTNEAYTRVDKPDNRLVADLTSAPVLGSGNKAVIEYLSGDCQNHGARLVHTHKYKHKYPYDWRSKRPVIVRATAQWFADVGEIRDATLQEIDKIRFIPPAGKERLTSFVRNRSEWCISRQRAWGVPIPALYRQDTGETLLTPESVAHILKVIAERGIDAWWTDAPDDPSWIPTENRGDGCYERGRDTMDVWFDSGTSWTHMGKTETGFESRTADVYLEGSDQHRGWFQSSILTKIAHDTATGAKPASPFRTLITHGFTLDGQGKKMSKSIGNTIAPEQIMDGSLLPPLKRKGKKLASGTPASAYDALGPDALRLWVAGSDYTKDVHVGETVLKGVNGSLSKLRVTFRLLTGLLADYPHQEHRRRLEELEPVDIVAMMHLSRLSQAAWQAYTGHEHHKAVTAINQYINADFSAFYMETVKDRLYTEKRDGSRRRDAQFVLWHVFEELCSILRPITPLLVEEARAHLSATASLGSTITPARTLAGEDLQDANALVLTLQENVDPSNRLNRIKAIIPWLDHVNSQVKAMQEEQREAKHMGSSLQSWVLLQARSDEARAKLQNVIELMAGDDVLTVPRSEGNGSLQHSGHCDTGLLSDYFVVSSVGVDYQGNWEAKSELKPDAWHSYRDLDSAQTSQLRVFIHEPLAPKCERCWKYTVTETHGTKNENLCARCENVVGEQAQ